jgi:4-amino-4-deoxy-L-arabinose transferase-like glycosyltransferase
MPVLAALVALAVAQCLWVLLPAVDFDEALYAENARQMAATGQLAQPFWDGRPMYDKTPPYMWTLVPFAQDYSPASPWAGRVRAPSVILSLLLALAIGVALSKQNNSRGPLFYGALYFAALLPFLGAGLVLIDLLLSLLLLPAFVVLDQSFRSSKDGRVAPLAWAASLAGGVAMGASTATKGLIGLVLPGLAAFVAVACMGPLRDAVPRGLDALRKYALMIGLALALSIMFYGWLWLSGHDDFVRSFFVVHHFSRGSSAMEGHSGSLVYHPLVVLLGGGWSIALLLRLMSQRTRASFDFKESFPLIWMGAIIVFFSLMATKLPNYTWPCWLALPFALVRWSSHVNQHAHDARSTNRIDRAASWLILVVALAMLLAGLGLAALPHLLPMALDQFGQIIDHRMAAMLRATPLQPRDPLGFLLAGCALALLAVFLFRVARTSLPAHELNMAPWVVVTQSLVLVAVITGVGPYLKRLYIAPVVQAAVTAASDYGDHKVITYGLKSPMFSSAYRGQGPIMQVGANSDVEQNQEGQIILVLPQWSKKNCLERGGTPTQTIAWLTLCQWQNEPARTHAQPKE